MIVTSVNGHSEVVKQLHQYGAQVDLQNNNGSTALMGACQNGHSEVVKLLHQYGAQVDLQNNNGSTALMGACQNGHSEVVKLLHKYGAQVDLQNNDGWTALMATSQNGHSEVVKLLHQYGAQVDLQNNDGWTALIVASQNGHFEVVKLLLQYGAQVDLQNKDRRTALMAASETIGILNIGDSYTLTQEDNLRIMEQENDQDTISTNHGSTDDRSSNKESESENDYGIPDDENHYSMNVTVEEHSVTNNQQQGDTPNVATVDVHTRCGGAERDTTEWECVYPHSEEIVDAKEQFIPHDVSGYSKDLTVRIENEDSNCYSEEQHLESREMPPEEHTNNNQKRGHYSHPITSLREEIHLISLGQGSPINEYPRHCEEIMSHDKSVSHKYSNANVKKEDIPQQDTDNHEQDKFQSESTMNRVKSILTSTCNCKCTMLRAVCLAILCMTAACLMLTRNEVQCQILGR